MKSILFIAPPFYEYPKLIKRELESRFDVVHSFKSYPQNVLYRFVAFFHLRKLERWVKHRYSNKILDQVNNKYDYVFIIKASELGTLFLEKLHAKTSARYVQYVWDDLKFDKGAKETFQFFDRIFSFCPSDCKQNGLEFRTNFFDPIECKLQTKSIDLFFVGGYKPNRLEFINKLVSLDQKEVLSLSINIKCGILLFLLEPRLWKYRRYVIFHSMSYKKMMNLLARSVAMIDVSERHQEGLTTRPFEAIAVNTKIITTNKNLCDYDFYNKNNVRVIREDTPSLDNTWLKMNYEPISDSILERYSIQSFIDDILS